MRNVDPEILANRARLELSIEEARERRAFKAWRLILALLAFNFALMGILEIARHV